ncbi:MAG: alpha/beta fold hydrolase [Polynucleobacter sp.]|nr:alpha/beta fold hydrolase [Polynucleobacter sp.]
MNRPSTDRIPQNWPLRELSSSVSTGQMEWHVQMAGAGIGESGAKKPVTLLLHGTGSSAHSWAELLPVLAKSHWVIAPDLPGHGFTISHQSEQLSLTLITHKLAELLRALGVEQIDNIIGHSAGATLGLQYSLLYPAPKRILGLNPSLVSLPSFYHSFLAPLINPIATSSFVSSMIADFLPFTSMIDKLLDSTNSKLNGIQRERYKLLFKQKNHINGSLNFMAATDIPNLLSHAQEITSELTFLVANQDSWVRKEELLAVIHRYFPRSTVIQKDGGHLFHEANPEAAMAIIQSALGLAQ